MKRGWLLYTRENAVKNEWFISSLRAEFSKFGIQLTLKMLPENGDFDKAFTEELPEFAIVRSICPKANEWLQSRGVRVLNNAKTAQIACDKWQTYQFCKAHTIPVLPTFQEPRKGIDYPLVMKTTDGHGGTEVFWVAGEEEYQKRRAELTNRAYILQQPSDTLGKYMLISAIGGQIVGAVLRPSTI